jgi:hypothetical protein
MYPVTQGSKSGVHAQLGVMLKIVCRPGYLKDLSGQQRTKI